MYRSQIHTWEYKHNDVLHPVSALRVSAPFLHRSVFAPLRFRIAPFPLRLPFFVSLPLRFLSAPSSVRSVTSRFRPSSPFQMPSGFPSVSLQLCFPSPPYPLHSDASCCVPFATFFLRVVFPPPPLRLPLRLAPTPRYLFSRVAPSPRQHSLFASVPTPSCPLALVPPRPFVLSSVGPSFALLAPLLSRALRGTSLRPPISLPSPLPPRTLFRRPAFSPDPLPCPSTSVFSPPRVLLSSAYLSHLPTLPRSSPTPVPCPLSSLTILTIAPGLSPTSISISTAHLSPPSIYDSTGPQRYVASCLQHFLIPHPRAASASRNLSSNDDQSHFIKNQIQNFRTC